jgi:hypothetical protein
MVAPSHGPRGACHHRSPSISIAEADEEILTSTVSDEAIEAAADTEKSPVATIVSVPVEMPWCC